MHEGIADRSFASVCSYVIRSTGKSAGGSWRRRHHRTPIFHLCRSFCNPSFCFTSKYHIQLQEYHFSQRQCRCKIPVQQRVYIQRPTNPSKGFTYGVAGSSLPPPETDCHVDPPPFFNLSSSYVFSRQRAYTFMHAPYMSSIFQ